MKAIEAMAQSQTQSKVFLSATWTLPSTCLRPADTNSVTGFDKQASLSSLTSSGRLAHEMAGTIDGRFEDTDEDSDWDRYSYGDEDENSSGGTGSGRNLSSGGKQSGQLEMRHSARVQETSIFGLTDKRRPEPLRSVPSYSHYLLKEIWKQC